MSGGEAIDQLLTRTLTVERGDLATRAAGDERIPVSLSSDLPVDRAFGREVLLHTREAIDMSRAVNGLPLLYNHDTDQPIGRLEDVQLRRDGKLGGMMRFSANPKGQEVLRDVIDGILTDTSLGYRITAWDESRGEDGLPTYTATKWTPMEGSIVPVPADHTVGAYRSANTTTPAPSDAWEDHPYMPHAASQEDRGMPRDLETKLIAQAAETFGRTADLSRWISEGRTLDEVRAEIANTKINSLSRATPAGTIELSAGERREYNLSRAILSLADQSGRSRSGLEWEVSDTIAKQTGRAAQGLFMPLSLSTRASIIGNMAGTSSLGGAAVQTTLMPLIEILRNRLVLQQAGARFLSGLTDTVSFPRQITANTLSWTGENPSSPNTLTALTMNNVTLSPKTAMASSSFSRQMLVQSSPDVQHTVADDLATVLALGLDDAGLNGTGTLLPVGVRNTASIGNRTLGTHGAALTWADLVGLESDLGTANADGGSMAYVTNAAVRGKLKTTLRSTTAGSSYLWEGGAEGSINGYRAFATNLMPSNLTQGTSTTICSSIIMANWSELLVGIFGAGVDLVIDPYSAKNQNVVEVTAILMADIGVRHAASFSKSDCVLV